MDSTNHGERRKETLQPRTAPVVAKQPCERLSAAHARYRIDLASLLDRHDMLWGEPAGPPADWRAGAPIGNGDFGAMVYGYPESLSFVLGKNNAINRQGDNESFFPTETFAEFRQTYFDNDAEAFKRILEQAALKYPKTLPHLTTCGVLRLHVDEGEMVCGCSLRVALRDGQAHLDWNNERVSTLVSRRYDVMLIRISGESENLSRVGWELSRPRLAGSPPLKLDTEPGYCFLTQEFDGGGGYTIGLAPRDGVISAEEALGRIAGVIDPEQGRSCSLLLTIVDTDDAEDAPAECRRRLSAARQAGREAIEDDHRAWWRDYWLRGLASVGDPAVETWYYRSLYLCGSLLRPDGQSPGLQGLWAGENVPIWNADFHTNVNIQCVYWGMLTNNRLDLMEPYLRHYVTTAAAARDDAANYYHMRGLRYPHAGSIGGHETSIHSWAILGTDVCGSAWVTQLFWQYYEWTQDRVFLEDTAYPLLRDVALFYADYLLWNDETDQWDIAPSVHFESKCPNFEAWGRNSLYAQAMFRGAFVRAIAAARTLGKDEEHVDLWQGRLDKLAPAPTTDEGYWKAMQDREPYHGGHNYILPIVFPAELVSRFHGPGDWFEQAAKTLAHARAEHPGYDGDPGFGGQTLCEVLRIDDTGWAFANARFPDDGTWGPNAMTRIWSWGPFQSDIGPGMCRVLADMMLLGLDGVVHLFPGIPEGVPARFHSLRAPGAFLISAEKRGERVDYIQVRSLAGKMLRLENPWPDGAALTVLSSDEVVTGLSATAIVELPTRADVEYVILPHGATLTQIPVVDFAINSEDGLHE